MDYQINKEESGKRLDIFLLSALEGKTRSHIKNLIASGKILVNDKEVKSGYELKNKDKIFVSEEAPIKLDAKPEDIDIEIVYQDEDLLVVNKPQGMVVHPAHGNHEGTLVNALLYSVKDLSGINGTLRPGIVHRLDKDTSGLMLVAKNDISHVSLQKQIQEKSCKRKYLALVHGVLKEDSGRIETCFGRHPKERKKMSVLLIGKKAVTNFNVVKRFVKHTLVEFELETGRTHQIRVHSKHIGHPVVGDAVYGKEDKGLVGQLLHSYSISFSQPKTNEVLEFKIELPEYFKNFMISKKLK